MDKIITNQVASYDNGPLLDYKMHAWPIDPTALSYNGPIFICYNILYSADIQMAMVDQ